MSTYDVVAYEIRLGTAVHEYRTGDGAEYATSTPSDDARDQGVAFYASDAPLDGFAPVYRWQRGDEIRYAPESPGEGYTRGAAAFYAPLAASVAASPTTRYRAVYEWSKDASHVLSTQESGLEQYGYERGAAAFYAP
jgi:hypothetical protein